ncbi:MAG: type II toxin-antitoxin system Phd/YefM family antitoxin [Holophagales bacterium]|nr:type II toxin-antitoxin system Phd/YefM family antitoxin [Holophagales bacterium]
MTRPDLRSIRELSAKTDEIIEQARHSGRPVFVTSKGERVAVILDLGEYEALAAGSFARAVREGDDAARAGDLHPHSRAVEILDSFGK